MIDWSCLDCQSDTQDILEYYMVHDDLWESTGLGLGDGLLCIGCLECRLGRELQSADFTDAPLNDSDFPWPKSDRLRDRLNRVDVTVPNGVRL